MKLQIAKRLVDENGNDVGPGDVVFTFRGEKAKFIRIDQYPSPGKSGKVTTTLGTHYPSVYDLKFV